MSGVRNITRTDVNEVLLACAVRVHGLNPRSTKDQETLSIRVGACNILYGHGVSVSILEHRLPFWRSVIPSLFEDCSNSFRRQFSRPDSKLLCACLILSILGRVGDSSTLP